MWAVVFVFWCNSYSCCLPCTRSSVSGCDVMWCDVPTLLYTSRLKIEFVVAVVLLAAVRRWVISGGFIQLDRSTCRWAVGHSFVEWLSFVFYLWLLLLLLNDQPINAWSSDLSIWIVHDASFVWLTVVVFDAAAVHLRLRSRSWNSDQPNRWKWFAIAVNTIMYFHVRNDSWSEAAVAALMILLLFVKNRIFVYVHRDILILWC